MKKIVSSFIIVGLLLLNSSYTFAGGGHIGELEYSYNGEFKTFEENKITTLNGYINPSSLQIGDDGLYGTNIYDSENVLKELGANHFIRNKAMGLFYSNQDYGDDFNKGLMLFLSKSLLNSLNSLDSTYFESGKQKMYNNGNNVYSINSEIKGGISPKTEIVNKISEKSKVEITGQFKNININENFYYCSSFYKDWNGNFIDSNSKEDCTVLTTEIKKEYLNGYLNDDDFYQKFKSTWNSKMIINKTLNTKIFIVNTITINGKTYGNYSKIYNVPVSMKKQLDKTAQLISNGSFEKKEELLSKIGNLLVFQKYGSKNYEILNYLKDKIENTYSEKRINDAQDILDGLLTEFHFKELFGDFVIDLE